MNDTRVPVAYDVPTEDGVRPVRLTDDNLIVADLQGHAVAIFNESEPRQATKSGQNNLFGYRPQLNLTVADKLGGGDDVLSVVLTFDRHPRHWPALILQQVPELRERLRLRQALLTLQSKLLTDPSLKARLADLLRRDPAALQAILSHLAALPAEQLQAEAGTELTKSEDQGT